MFLIWMALLAMPQDSILSIRFIGNEAFEISDGRTTMLTDYPYRSGVFGYMTYDEKSVQTRGQVVLLITHGHLDHFDLTLARDKFWRILGPREVTSKLTNARTIVLDSLVYVQGMRIYPTATPHSGIEHYSYRIQWGKWQLYFVGDTDDPKALLAQSVLDYAFVTPWLWQKVRSRGARIDAHHIVIYHHKTNERVTGCADCWIPKQGETRITSKK